jgi:multiple sugar transport system substrate-binding protein
MKSKSKRMSRRDFLRSAGLTGASVLLAGCVQQVAPAAPSEAPAEAEAPAAAKEAMEAPPAEAVTLSFLTQGGSDAALNRYNPLIDQFQEANPDITIEAIWEPGGAIEIQTKLLTLIAAGDAPDVYWAHSYTNAGQAKRNIQMDLNPMIEADAAVSGEDFLPAAWADFSIGGKQIGFPRETTSTIIIYNKQLFEENGVPLPTDDWTWADFEEAAAALTQGEGPERIFGLADWNLNRNTWVKMWQKGGDVLSEDRTTYTMNEPVSVEQVQLIADWHHVQQFHISGVEMGGFATADIFVTGRIGMFPQFSVFTGILPAEFEWDIAHLPVDPDDIRTTRVASAGHSMYSGTEKPEAAWKWISYLAGEDAFWHFVDTGLSLPSLRAVAEDPKFLDPSKPPAHAQIMIDAFDYGRPEPVAGDWIGVHREIQPALDAIYGVEKADPQTTLDAIADRVNELIAYVPEA